jgi:hypothetical protein
MSQKRRLSRLDVKQAILTDARFRDLFPELKKEIAEVLNNPSCACNIPIYDIFFKYKGRLAKYFSSHEIKSPQEEVIDDNKNHWNVINCKVEELEEVLNKLHKVGRVQIAVARYQDELTVVVNDPGILF